MKRFLAAGLLILLSAALIVTAWKIDAYMRPRLLDDGFRAQLGRALHDGLGLKAEKARRASWIKNLCLVGVPLLWAGAYVVLAYWRPEASARRLRARAERERRLAEHMTGRVQRMHQTQTFEKAQARDRAKEVRARADALEARARELERRS